MSGRKRKPIPMEAATEAVVWRARILCEILDAYEEPAERSTREALNRLHYALADYENSKLSGGGGANGSAPHGVAKSEQLELQRP